MAGQPGMVESIRCINYKCKHSHLLSVRGVPGTVLRFNKYIILELSPQRYKVSSIVMPIYLMRKLRFREGNRLVRQQAVRGRVWTRFTLKLDKVLLPLKGVGLGSVTLVHRSCALVSGQSHSRKVQESALELLLLSRCVFSVFSKHI